MRRIMRRGLFIFFLMVAAMGFGLFVADRMSPKLEDGREHLEQQLQDEQNRSDRSDWDRFWDDRP